MYTLLLLKNDQPVTRFSLVGETTIGRSSDSTIQMLDTHFSRHHAVIEEGEDGLWLRDTHSRNGTYYNGVRVTSPVRLDRDGRIQIGNHAFIINPQFDVLTSDKDESVVLLPHTTTGKFTTTKEVSPASASLETMQFVHQITLQLLAKIHVSQMLQFLLEQMMEVFSADRGFILLKQSGQQWQAAAVKSDGRAMGLSQALLERVMQSPHPIGFSNAIEQVSFAEARSVIEHKLRSVMLAPLVVNSTLLGVIQIDTRRTDAYTATHLQQLAVITQTAAHVLLRARQNEQAQQKLATLSAQSRCHTQFVGSTPPVIQLLTATQKAAPTDAKILIEGESGTGKELIARMTHELSKRCEGPFVAINCAAIPDTLIESELFGHEKGAFTDATKRKSGAFELAHTGTLFLDEVGELPAMTQAKLLRVLQEQCFYRLGSERPTRVDVRIIAATNRQLAALVNQGRFRSDLFFRLNVVRLCIPPLRERIDDIEALCAHFLKSHAAAMGISVPSLSPAALRKLKKHGWPGNVRELQNTLERALVFLEGKELRPAHLSVGSGVDEPNGELPENLADALQEVERKLIHRALLKTQGKKKAACERLGISRPTLDKKIAIYGDGLPGGAEE